MDKSLLDMLWLIMASGLVFIMQGGFALVESGLTRGKNSINVAIKNLTDLGVSIIFYWIFGFALMFGMTFKGWFGVSDFFVDPAGSTWIAGFFLFQTMFCSTAATIVSGAVAERMKFFSYILATILLSAILYPVFGHWAWGGALIGQTDGWLANLGFVDFAGSTVVHSTGGWLALALLLLLGPRMGRFGKNGEVNKVSGSNIPMAVLGVILLWFGWFGFNGGSTLSMDREVAGIILRTTLAAASGLVVTLTIGWYREKIPDVTLVMNGALAGLVAITAPAHCVNELSAVIIGAVGGAVMYASQIGLEKLRIDDAVGAIPVHLFAGIWGTLAVALFGDPEVLGTGHSLLKQIGVQSLGIVANGVWVFVPAFIILWIFNKFIPLRVTPEEEAMGLNVAEHGASTEIFDLYNTMEEQGRTGNLNLRVPVEPFTEVGQIAQRYNNLMDSLQENLIAKEEYLSILDNVTDGLFLIDKDYKIGPYYSNALEKIFHQDNLANTNFLNYIKAVLPEEKLDSIKDYIELCFDEVMAWRNVLRLNPLEKIEINIDSGDGGFITKTLSFNFKRVLQRDRVIRLMVVTSDVSESVRLGLEIQASQKKSQSEMELFYRILHVEPGILQEFITSMRTDLQVISELLEEPGEDLSNIVSTLYRSVHSIKGDASLLKLDFVADQANQFEDKLEMARGKSEISVEDFLPLTIQFANLEKTVKQIEGLIQRLMAFQNKFSAHNIGSKDVLSFSLENLVQRLSEKLEKSVKLVVKGIQVQSLPDNLKKPLKDIAVQLVRNSLVHGIEAPEHREKSGKQKQGIIEVQLKKVGDELRIIYKDDGAGIPLEKLKEVLLKRGHLNKEEIDKLSEKKLMEQMFLSGISTSGSVSIDSGRGVGMDLIKSLLDKLGGKIKASTRQGEYTRFDMSIPL